MPKKSGPSNDPIVDELESIKRLLAFGLLRSGASQGDIASALGVNQSNVSRMFPKPIGAAKSKVKGSKRGKAIK